MNDDIKDWAHGLNGWWNGNDLASNLQISVDTAASKDWSDLQVIDSCNGLCLGTTHLEPWESWQGDSNKIELDQESLTRVIHEAIENIMEENEPANERPTIEKYHIKHK